MISLELGLLALVIIQMGKYNKEEKLARGNTPEGQSINSDV